MNTKNFYDKAQGLLDETYNTLDGALKDFYLKASNVLDAIYDASESDSEQPQKAGRDKREPNSTGKPTFNDVAPEAAVEDIKKKIEEVVQTLSNKGWNFASESWKRYLENDEYKNLPNHVIGHLNHLHEVYAVKK